MCAKCDEIRELILLSELETEIVLAEAEDGFSVPYANRPLTDAERRAGTRFGDIAAMHDGAEAEALGILEGVESVVEAAIVSAIFGAGDETTGPAVLRGLAEVNASQPKGVQEAVLGATYALANVFRGVYSRSASIVLDEAKRQGSKAAALAVLPDVPVKDFVAPAASAAMNPWTRTTTKLQAVLGSPAAIARAVVTRTDVRGALAEIPLDQSLDIARQGVNQAAARGRHEIAETLEPSEIWASEIMDNATCGPCQAIDGKEYETLAEARGDYPTGGYERCDGDARCRGTLVYIFPAGQEAPPPPPNLVPPPDPKPPAPVAPVTTPPAPAPNVLPAPRVAPGPPEPTAAAVAARPRRPKGQPQRFTGLDQLPVKAPELRAADTSLEDAVATNPDFDRTHKTRVYNNNCTHVTSAWEMRRRGYDVTASPVKGGSGRYDADYLPFWRDPKTGKPPVYTRHSDPDDLTAAILRQPDGARGIVQAHWKSGGAHVWNYEKVDGKVNWIEAQSGKPDAAGHLASAKPATLKHFRTDTLEPTDYLAKEALASRPPDMVAEIAAKDELIYRKKYSEGRAIWRGQEGMDYEAPRFKLEGKEYVRISLRDREKLRQEWIDRQLAANPNFKLAPRIDS